MDLVRYADYLRKRDPFVYEILGIEVQLFEPGKTHLGLRITPGMVNSFGVTHGGVLFTLADTACAMAANSLGFASPTIAADIQMMGASKPGDFLRAEGIVNHSGRSTKFAGFTIFKVDPANADGAEKVIARGSTTALTQDLALEPLLNADA